MIDEDEESDAARRAALSAILTVDDYRPLSSQVRIEYGARSVRGKSRPHNDDHCLVLRLSRQQDTLATSLSDAEMPPPFDEWAYAMLVADGLGEGGAGSAASRVALSTIAHLVIHYGKWHMRIDPRTASEMVARAHRLYAGADAAVRAKSRTSPQMAGISTTLTAAYSVGDDLFVAHVGHSRAYLFRHGTLTPLTCDHTVERQLADSCRPVGVESRAQDLCHVLTDALGAPTGYPSIEVEQVGLKNGDCVLLCTNGLTDVLGDGRIADVLASRRRPDEQCAILTDLANQESGDDNITVLVAEYSIPVEREVAP
jgi:serine/threonine protein phosphatase PrpC